MAWVAIMGNKTYGVETYDKARERIALWIWEDIGELQDWADTEQRWTTAMSRTLNDLEEADRLLQRSSESAPFSTSIRGKTLKIQRL